MNLGIESLLGLRIREILMQFLIIALIN